VVRQWFALGYVLAELPALLRDAGFSTGVSCASSLAAGTVRGLQHHACNAIGSTRLSQSTRLRDSDLTGERAFARQASTERIPRQAATDNERIWPHFTGGIMRAGLSAAAPDITAADFAP